MPGRIDAHLERALDRQNDLVNSLEENGSPRDLLDAYVNRAVVLSMMGYTVSAMDDLDSAEDIVTTLGEEVDQGTRARILTLRGHITGDMGDDPFGYYEDAFTHIANSDDRSRHFDLHSYVMECIVAAEFLNDFTHHDLAVDYVRRGLEVIGGKGDRWSLNHRMRLLNLGGEALLDGGDAASALAMFDEAVGIGTELMERSSVDGYDEIMFSLVNRADCRIALDDFDGYLRDAEVAVKFAEELRDTGIMDMKDEIVRIHQEMAEVLMKRGDFKGAEKHLMSAMGISIDGAREYIELHSQE